MQSTALLVGTPRTVLASAAVTQNNVLGYRLMTTKAGLSWILAMSHVCRAHSDNTTKVSYMRGITARTQ